MGQTAENLIRDDDFCWGEFHEWYWNGFKCHWRVLGEANNPPIVFIHGFGASSAHWRRNASFFSKAGFRVYGLDLIGFGLSDQPGPSKKKLNNYFWSKQLSTFLEEIVLNKSYQQAILIGNSLGGLVAITTASMRDDLVKAVISSPLPDPAFMQKVEFPEIAFLKRIVHFLVHMFFYLLPLELIVPIIARTSIIKKALQLAYHRSVKDDRDLLRLVNTPAKRNTAPRALRAMCIGMTLRPYSYTAPYFLDQLSARLKKCPVFLLWGEQDKLVPLNIGKQIKREYPWIDLLVIGDSGHCVHDETSQEFNQNVFNWLMDLKLFVNT